VSWTEADSKLYQELAMVAVPRRAEQMATLLTLLPFGVHEPARVVELSCGEGFLSSALLNLYPQAHVVALDTSDEMLARTRDRLSEFPGRFDVEPFDIHSSDWHTHLDNADAVVSSLAVHHLDGPEKQSLFKSVAGRVSSRGALLMADLVEPQRTEARELFAAGWDRSAEQQAQQPGGSERAFQQFQETHWNIYRYPDPFDKPSPLSDQLFWLRDAGFAVVDCFWLHAAHAIYGGYRSPERLTSAPPMPFEDALRAATAALHA
jgi:tRNA (cmo5U34)-methyltransferase